MSYKLTHDRFVKSFNLDIRQSNNSVHVQYEKDIIDVPMTRSIPESNLGNITMASTSSLKHIENASSRNRLLPHLNNESSLSMPRYLSARTRSGTLPNLSEMDDHVSELSSIQSSMCPSVVENSTTEESSQKSSLIGNCQSRLAQDLLRMFLEEIETDVIVEVSGKQIKAHKCILSSRLSYNVVHFALRHIYSGLTTLPDSISIMELLAVANLLSLEGLKEAIVFKLKATYCHNFHRPCQVCTAGVLECFHLSSFCGLDYLYRECLRWITKYFSEVWPTKAFAALPEELLDKCYKEHIDNLTLENFIDTVYGCGIIVESLQNSKWAEIVARMCRRIVNTAAHFAAPRLVCVLEIIATVPNDTQQSAKQELHECLTAAIEWAPLDETCRAYAFLSDVVREIRNQEYSKSDLISNGSQTKIPDPINLLYTHAGLWCLQCEDILVRAAPRIVGTQAIKDLPSDFRQRLQELCKIDDLEAVAITSSPLQDRESRSVLPSKPDKFNIKSDETRTLEQVRNSLVPHKTKTPAIVGPDKLGGNVEFRERKKLKTVQTTAKFQTKTIPSQDGNTISVRRPNTRENKRPRYLHLWGQSSRNSSPAPNGDLQTKQSKTMSQNSLATSSRPRTAEPSTDSVGEPQTSNEYATSNDANHTCKRTVESGTSSKHGRFKDQGTDINIKRRRLASSTLNKHLVSPKLKNTTQIRSIPGSSRNATKLISSNVASKIPKPTPQTRLKSDSAVR